MITSEDISKLQKEISILMKKFRGVGPKSHSVKAIGNELQIIVQGTLVPIEKYFFQTYGQEYIDAVYKFYFDRLQLSIKEINDAFNNKYQFKLTRWEPDFLNDRILYVLHYNQEKTDG